jgi:hypothetical protein
VSPGLDSGDQNKLEHTKFNDNLLAGVALHQLFSFRGGNKVKFSNHCFIPHECTKGFITDNSALNILNDCNLLPGGAL